MSRPVKMGSGTEIYKIYRPADRTFTTTVLAVVLCRKRAPECLLVLIACAGCDVYEPGRLISGLRWVCCLCIVINPGEVPGS